MATTRKFMVARQLGGKRVVTNRGEEIGRLNDIIIDEREGRFEFLVVEPNSDSKLAKKHVIQGRPG